jgi:hypothetical protein
MCTAGYTFCFVVVVVVGGVGVGVADILRTNTAKNETFSKKSKNQVLKKVG